MMQTSYDGTRAITYIFVGNQPPLDACAITVFESCSILDQQFSANGTYFRQGFQSNLSQIVHLFFLIGYDGCT